MNKTFTVRTKQVLLPVLLLALTLPFSATAAECDFKPDLSREMDTFNADGGLNNCKQYVHMAYLHWRNFTCYKNLGIDQDKDEYLKQKGINSPPKKDRARNITGHLAVDLAFAGEGLEETQLAVLTKCHKLERSEKAGVDMHW